MRDTMENIVKFVREYGQASYNDEFGGQTYWSDDQLQDVADRYTNRGFTPLKLASPDKLIWRVLLPNGQRIEPVFSVWTDDGSTQVATTSVYDFNRNELTFDTALNTDYEYRVYAPVANMYEALADLWTLKANQRFDYIDWKAQNNKMSMQQEYDHCVKQALYYRSKTVRTFKRNGKGKWYDG